jgi:hypothetical protein
MQHCEDHGKTAVCLETQKKALEECKRDRKGEIKEIGEQIKTKVTTTLFCWVIGLMVVVIGGMMSAQWNLLLNMSNKLDRMAQLQQYEMGKAERRHNENHKND